MRKRYMMKMKTMETSKNDIPQCLVWVHEFEEEEIGIMEIRIVMGSEQLLVILI